MKTNRYTCLVTALGTATSTSIVRGLREVGRGYRIVGADINERNRVASSLDVDEYVQFPPAVPDRRAYLSHLLRYCEENGVDYLFASIDEEVAECVGHRSEFGGIGTTLCMPNELLLEVCHDKRRFGEWIRGNFPEAAIREYVGAAAWEGMSYPVFVKPSEGRASIGCTAVERPEQLAEAVERAGGAGRAIVQECLEGEVVVVDVARNGRTGQIVQAQRRELIRNKNGCGIAVETIADERLAALCRSMAERLSLNGVVNIEFFRLGDEYKVIEVNPRFSAGVAYSIMSGANFPYLAVLAADGEPFPDVEVATGRHFAKRYETYEL